MFYVALARLASSSFLLQFSFVCFSRCVGAFSSCSSLLIVASLFPCLMLFVLFLLPCLCLLVHFCFFVAHSFLSHFSLVLSFSFVGSFFTSAAPGSAEGGRVARGNCSGEELVGFCFFLFLPACGCLFDAWLRFVG